MRPGTNTGLFPILMCDTHFWYRARKESKEETHVLKVFHHGSQEAFLKIAIRTGPTIKIVEGSILLLKLKGFHAIFW